jgi:hypothetical protein
MAFGRVTQKVVCDTINFPWCKRAVWTKTTIDNRVEVHALFTNGEHVCSVVMVTQTMVSSVHYTLLSTSAYSEKVNWGDPVRLQFVKELREGTRALILDPNISILPVVNRALNNVTNGSSVWGPYAPILRLKDLGSACKVRVEFTVQKDIVLVSVQDFATIRWIAAWAQSTAEAQTWSTLFLGFFFAVTLVLDCCAQR